MLLDVLIFAIHVRLNVVWMYVCQLSLQFSVRVGFHRVCNPCSHGTQGGAQPQYRLPRRRALGASSHPRYCSCGNTVALEYQTPPSLHSQALPWLSFCHPARQYLGLPKGNRLWAWRRCRESRCFQCDASVQRYPRELVRCVSPLHRIRPAMLDHERLPELASAARITN